MFEPLLQIISVLVLSWCIVYLCLHWIAIAYGRRKLNSRKMAQYSHESVSIIKPLNGPPDPNLKENLRSFFKLDYPRAKFELLFCLEDGNDHITLSIIEALCNEYPDINVKIFQDGEAVGVNPKINNLMPGYRNAQYPLLWLSDSGVKTPINNLTEMMTHIHEHKVAVVHQLPFVAPAQGFTSYLDKVYFGTQYARITLLSDMFKQNCINGMSWLVKKEALETVGGLQAFGEYLAEDYFIADALMKSGWKFVLSGKPATQNRENCSFEAFRNRLIRWARLRVTMVPIVFFLCEPITGCLSLALVGGLSTSCLEICPTIVFVGLYIIIWFFSDLILIRTVSNGHLGSLLFLIPAWLCIEAIMYWCYLCGAVSRRVTWGGKKFRLSLGGKAVRDMEASSRLSFLPTLRKLLYRPFPQGKVDSL